MTAQKFHKIKRSVFKFLKEPFVTLIFISSILLFILMTIIFIAEQETNSKINTFFDSFWYTLVTITTVGYGDIAPESIEGRIAGIFLLLFGVAVFGALSGKIASILLDYQMKLDRRLIKLKNKKKHFIICGWKPDFEQILEGIIKANPQVDTNSIIAVNTAP